ncbi:helix-turn-helix domain-containing protein [Nocardia sp. NPDC020380]|uniref:helix-turn-helix domain-containing protein n=1 Tax=Nocardia sp. NPDC020380 TaxID=3364309 RepID=UPI00378CD756
MSGVHQGIADYLRGRREAVGLTRAELSRLAGISEALIQKIEQGTRSPTATALSALCDALGVSPQFRDHAAGLLQPAPVLEFHDGLPDSTELDFLRSMPFPACFHTPPAVDVLAANDAYMRWFPGIVPGANIVEWMMTNPAAREVTAEWEREAHLIVYGFRYMAPAFLAPERIEEIIRACAAAPDWERFWSTDIVPVENPRRPIRMKSPDTGEWVAMSSQILRFEFPRRAWWMHTMNPIH